MIDEQSFGFWLEDIETGQRYPRHRRCLFRCSTRWCLFKDLTRLLDSLLFTAVNLLVETFCEYYFYCFWRNGRYVNKRIVFGADWSGKCPGMVWNTYVIHRWARVFVRGIKVRPVKRFNVDLCKWAVNWKYLKPESLGFETLPVLERGIELDITSQAKNSWLVISSSVGLWQGSGANSLRISDRAGREIQRGISYMFPAILE